MDTSQSNPTYLYAIVPELPTEDLGNIGLYGADVHTLATLADGQLIAVVSDLPSSEELRPERKHLAAHQAVVNRVVSESPVVLPVSFGTIADSPEGIKDLLERYGNELTAQMEKVRGKSQMNVRLTYQGPNVFQHLIEKRRPDLKSALDAMFAHGRKPTRDEKIDLGQKLDGVLTEARDSFAEQMESLLGEVCDEIKRNPPRSEKELFRLACLLGKDDQKTFDATVDKAANNFGETLVLEKSGPYPAYDFTELHLKV